MTVKSAGMSVYEANDIHKVIFIKNLLDFSDDYSRSVANNQFWYLDNDATTVTTDPATDYGMRQRAVLSHEGITVETILPLNRYSFFEGLSCPVLKDMLHLSSSRRDANGTWVITPGVKNPKHVFVFFQQTQKQKTFTQNPYIFDTFDLDGYNSAKLATYRLQYGTTFYPELDYEGDFKIIILNDLIDFRYRKNDYNYGVQLQLANFEALYPIIYFDLRNVKEILTADLKKT